LTIKPVESIAGAQIEVENDISLSSFENGSASAVVEVMQRRKHWDSDIGLSPYIEAYRQAIRERGNAKESDFQDDGDFVILRYEITISEDLEIQEAIKRVENTITVLEKRADQLAHRRVDSLTGVFDRGSFDADLTHLLDYPNAHPLSLLVIDLDKFKVINDSYGHEAGNEVLKNAANLIRLTCKTNGTCYRYGGDEMTVLLPRYNLRRAVAIAEQIRFGIEGLKFEKSPETITASIGVTSYPEVTKLPDDIFSDADAMVYQAKDDGGNAVRGSMGSETGTDSARTMRLDIASRVEAVELWMRLESGHGQNYSVIVTNHSDEDVTVEAIMLKKDKVYLSEPGKPAASDDWKIGKGTSKTIRWEPKTRPVRRLQTKEPKRNPGEIIEIDIGL
jgi:diguanylate cyclase (GGDEF)-like protein